jgi:hypothetical protein
MKAKTTIYYTFRQKYFPNSSHTCYAKLTFQIVYGPSYTPHCDGLYLHQINDADTAGRKNRYLVHQRFGKRNK